jgi:outer membrane biosynthesis protein TonB
MAASSPPATKPQVLVIEEPPPPEPQPEPEPEEAPAPQTPEPAARHKPRRTTHTDSATDQQEETPTEETPEAQPPAVPALEPRQSSAEESEQRKEFLELQQDLTKRLEKLGNAHLSGNDQKALEDARTFFSQANQAMANGDLSRALNLAHKAGLLLSALE